MTKSIYNQGDKRYEALSDVDLMSLITGTRNKNKFKAISVTELHKLSNESLVNKGLTKREANVLKSVFELSRRHMKAISTINHKQITNNEDSYELLFPVLYGLPHEEMHVVYVSRSNTPISIEKISQGGITGTAVDLKLIIKRALELMASGIILGHNHPSGNNNPSEADIRITKAVKNACALFDISVLDHIIIAGMEYYSMNSNGNF